MTATEVSQLTAAKAVTLDRITSQEEKTNSVGIGKVQGWFPLATIHCSGREGSSDAEKWYNVMGKCEDSGARLPGL